MGPRLRVLLALWISNSIYRGLGCLAAGETILGFTVAGGASSGYRVCLCTRLVEDGRNRRHHQIPFVSSLPSIHTAKNNKLEITGFTGYICFPSPLSAALQPFGGRQDRVAITLYPFNSNLVPYLADDAELWFRLFAEFTRIERAVAILIAMTNLMNEQRIFHRAVFHVKYP